MKNCMVVNKRILATDEATKSLVKNTAFQNEDSSFINELL